MQKLEILSLKPAEETSGDGVLPCRVNETKPSFEKEEEEKRETKIKKRIIHFAAVERLRVASLDSL